jgi:hypothetical protein
LAALLAVGRGLHRVASALPMADGTRVCAYRRVPVVFNLGAFAERPRLRFSAGPAGLALAHGLPNHGGHSGDVCIWPRGFDTATMPVFELPGPSSAFRVGTTRFSLLDSSRPETFTADPSDRRELGPARGGCGAHVVGECPVELLEVSFGNVCDDLPDTSVPVLVATRSTAAARPWPRSSLSFSELLAMTPLPPGVILIANRFSATG